MVGQLVGVAAAPAAETRRGAVRAFVPVVGSMLE
jgi:hypothetical protein